MPHILDPNKDRNAIELGKVDYKYDYPGDLDLRPGSKLHNRIKTEVMKKAREASGPMSNRFDSWNKIDETLTSYIETDDAEEAIIDKDHRKPISIIYPYSYAILETILGYLLAAFFQEPVFRYEGVSPEDTIGAIMLEKIIDIHCNRFKIILNLHTMFRDSLSYGFGVVAPEWRKTQGKKIVKETIPHWFAPDTHRKTMRNGIIFEGNALSNIDPYLCLPDPNISIADIQKGEFFGWIDHTNYYDLLSDEEHSDGKIFNVKYLKQITGKQTSIYSAEQSGRDKKSGGARVPFNNNATNPYDVIRMYMKLIPKEWELGVGEYPEKWYFVLGADAIVLEARSIGLAHDMFPIAISAPDFDGYSSTPVSRLETLYGLQHTLDWMFNAHIANVRKVINDTLIVDPYLINVPDLKDPRPGGIVRLRRPAWGRGVKDSVMQLAVSDVTRGHVADASIIQNAMDKIAATDSWTMGSLRQGGPERLTKGEFEGTRQGGYTRLERIARLIGVQAMQDVGYMFAHHTQQFMSKELSLTTTGRWQETLMKEFGGTTHIKASPFDILIDYDVKVRDGSVPGSNTSGVWINMFETLASQPELQQTFDIVRIFKHIARNSGAKNVDEFVRVKLQTDEEAEGQAGKGNMLPIDQILGG
ncbi:hypothetical protein KAX02_13750 [candidate division WOR-3 bacterium]|nr:hypothetical protein [candidate division WOR-3 bacterium]